MGVFAGLIAVLGGPIVLAWSVDSIAIQAFVAGIWLGVLGPLKTVAAVMMCKEVA